MRVKRLTLFLLTASLLLATSFAGPTAAPGQTALNLAGIRQATLEASVQPHNVYNGRYPVAPEAEFITMFAYYYQQPSYLRPGDNQKQGHRTARYAYGLRLGTSSSAGPASPNEHMVQIDSKTARSLTSLSPPGFSPRL